MVQIKFGVIPVHRAPGVVDPDYALGIARAAEREGVESIWMPEHVVIPVDYTTRYPYAPTGRLPVGSEDAFPDPLEWLAFVVGGTSTIRLATAVVILPQHNPVHLAKRLATLDVLSRGRVMLGLGVGWLREEFDALGAEFEHRGPRTDEYMQVLRALWGDGPASFDGEFVRFAAMGCRPAPVQAGGIPLIVGGHSPAVARRAGRLGDGFYPMGVSYEEARVLVELARASAIEAGRDPAAVELTVRAPADLEDAKRFAELGASRFVLSVAAGDVEADRRTIVEYLDTVIGRI